MLIYSNNAKVYFRWGMERWEFRHSRIVKDFPFLLVCSRTKAEQPWNWGKRDGRRNWQLACKRSSRLRYVLWIWGAMMSDTKLSSPCLHCNILTKFSSFLHTVLTTTTWLQICVSDTLERGGKRFAPVVKSDRDF